MKRNALLGLVIFFLVGKIAYATLPPLPADLSWFNIRMELDEASLPQGVTVRKYSDGSSYDYDWLIKNESKIILDFKLIIDKPKNNIASSTGLISPGRLTGSMYYVPGYKLVLGKVFPSEYFYKGKLVPYDGTVTCQESRCKLGGIVVDYKFLSLLGIEPSKDIYQNSRPTTIKIPEPESFDIPAYYGDTALQIKGRFIYSLNPNYEGSSEKNYGKVILFSVIGFFVLISSYFLTKKFNR